MKDGLYIVTTLYLCAGFVVEQGNVTMCAPILKARIKLLENNSSMSIGMTGKLAIHPQVHEGIFSWGIFLMTNHVFDGVECWQADDCEDVFVCYTKSIESAEKVVKMLSGTLGGAK